MDFHGFNLSPNAKRCGKGYSDRCPAHEDQHNSLSIGVGRDGRLLLKCHAGCTFEEILDAAGVRGAQVSMMGANPSKIRSQEIREQAATDRRIAFARELWDEALPIEGTIGERYLNSRGIESGFGALRLHPAHKLSEDGLLYPCILGKVERVDAFVGLHRTFLTPEGKKRYRSMLGQVMGGAVRLSSGHRGLAVAEGIETALSAQALYHPEGYSIWAALSAGGMRHLQLPVWRTSLVVYADGDEVGREAAYDLGEKAAQLGWPARTVFSPKQMDVNDALMVKRGLK
ncbi:MAG: hypothetical protein RI988_2963 [Pseudomonadota bacterium]